MSASLVGSEMCIRDRSPPPCPPKEQPCQSPPSLGHHQQKNPRSPSFHNQCRNTRWLRVPGMIMLRMLHPTVDYAGALPKDHAAKQRFVAVHCQLRPDLREQEPVHRTLCVGASLLVDAEAASMCTARHAHGHLRPRLRRDVRDRAQELAGEGINLSMH
eukprot:13610148-Alexandrium_andersonii.AAC.1